LHKELEMKKDIVKWIYTFFLLTATIGWSAFCVLTIKSALSAPTQQNVLEVAGVTVLLGALITWCGNVNQYWFRKKDPPADNT